MFDIEYKGGNCIVIVTKRSTAVIDPKLSVIGLKDLSVKDAIEIATETRFAIDDGEAQININGPGEYEVGDLSIRGIRAVRHIDTSADEPIATVYRIEIGEARLALIGNITPKLPEEQLEELGLVDIVIIPVGGGGLTLDATSAASIVRQIDPKVVIPVHYADSQLTYDMPQDTLETFVKEIGAPVETTPKYKVKSAAALPAALTIVEITRS